MSTGDTLKIENALFSKMNKAGEPKQQKHGKAFFASTITIARLALNVTDEQLAAIIDYDLETVHYLERTFPFRPVEARKALDALKEVHRKPEWKTRIPRKISLLILDQAEKELLSSLKRQEEKDGSQ